MLCEHKTFLINTLLNIRLTLLLDFDQLLETFKVVVIY